MRRDFVAVDSVNEVCSRCKNIILAGTKYYDVHLYNVDVPVGTLFGHTTLKVCRMCISFYDKDMVKRDNEQTH